MYVKVAHIAVFIYTCLPCRNPCDRYYTTWILQCAYDLIYLMSATIQIHFTQVPSYISAFG